MLASAVQPERRFLGVERIVGHHRDADSSHLKNASNVGVERLGSEESARLRQIQAVSGQTESLQNSDNAPRGFGYRSVFNEQRAPDGVGLLHLGKREILLRRCVR